MLFCKGSFPSCVVYIRRACRSVTFGLAELGPDVSSSVDVHIRQVVARMACYVRHDLLPLKAVPCLLGVYDEKIQTAARLREG